MTTSPEAKDGQIVENPVLAEKLERVRLALTELELARKSLGLRQYSPEELGAAYVANRITTKETRVALDEVQVELRADEGARSAYDEKSAEWGAYMQLGTDITLTLRSIVEQQAADEGQGSYYSGLAGHKYIQELDDRYFEGRNSIAD